MMLMRCDVMRCDWVQLLDRYEDSASITCIKDIVIESILIQFELCIVRRMDNGQYEITISRWTWAAQMALVQMAHTLSASIEGWSFHLVNAQIKLNLQNPSIQWMEPERKVFRFCHSLFLSVVCLTSKRSIAWSRRDSTEYTYTKSACVQAKHIQIICN